MDMSLAWLSEQLEMQDQGFMNQYDQMIKPYHQVGFSTVDSFSSERKNKNTSVLDQPFQIPPSVKVTNNIKKLPWYRKPISIDKKLTPDVENPKPEPNPLQDIPNTFTISFWDGKPNDEVISFRDSFDYTTGTKKVQTVTRNRIQLLDHKEKRNVGSVVYFFVCATS